MAQAGSKTKKIFDGRYEILSIVGRGARSVVYHARHALAPTAEVALKVLLEQKDIASNSDLLRREALAMVSSRHKYVIRLDDFHSVGNLCYLSMEYAPESDVRKYSAKVGGKLPPKQAESYFSQCAEALAFIHRAGIIHRDVKPDNILVMNEREIRIADFGLAVLPGEQASLAELQSGVGTMSYMAPEVLEGLGYNQASDLYALGVSFYELIAGKNPFDKAPLLQQLEIRKDSALPDIRKLVPEVSAKLAETIMRCLRYDGQERFASAKDIVQALSGRESIAPISFAPPPSSTSVAATSSAVAPVVPSIAPAIPSSSGTVVPPDISPKFVSESKAVDSSFEETLVTTADDALIPKGGADSIPFFGNPAVEPVQPMPTPRASIEIVPRDAYESAKSGASSMQSSSSESKSVEVGSPYTGVAHDSSGATEAAKVVPLTPNPSGLKLKPAAGSKNIASKKAPLPAPVPDAPQEAPTRADLQRPTPPISAKSVESAENQAINGTTVVIDEKSLLKKSQAPTQLRPIQRGASTSITAGPTVHAPINVTRTDPSVVTETEALGLGERIAQLVRAISPRRLIAGNNTALSTEELSRSLTPNRVVLLVSILFMLGLFIPSIRHGAVRMGQKLGKSLGIQSASSQLTSPIPVFQVKPEAMKNAALAFPFIPGGVYTGELIGFSRIHRALPLTIISLPVADETTSAESDLLIPLLGLEGWTPPVIELSDPKAHSLRIASNGIILKLKAENVDELGQLHGTFLNHLTGEKGTWVVRPTK